jgi:hypothetical protein
MDDIACVGFQQFLKQAPKHKIIILSRLDPVGLFESFHLPFCFHDVPDGVMRRCFFVLHHTVFSVEADAIAKIYFNVILPERERKQYHDGEEL